MVSFGQLKAPKRPQGRKAIQTRQQEPTRRSALPGPKPPRSRKAIETAGTVPVCPFRDRQHRAEPLPSMHSIPSRRQPPHNPGARSPRRHPPVGPLRPPVLVHFLTARRLGHAPCHPNRPRGVGRVRAAGVCRGRTRGRGSGDRFGRACPGLHAWARLQGLDKASAGGMVSRSRADRTLTAGQRRRGLIWSAT